MNKSLLVSAIIKFLFGLFLVMLSVFLPVGSIRYLNGWIFIFLLFVPMFAAGIIMWMKKPELLKRRLNAGEMQDGQKIVILLSAVMFIVGFAVNGICVRFGYFTVPIWVSLIFAVVFAIGYILYGIVLLQNEYLSRTIEVSENQKVTDTGLYSIVRHPMYFATLLMFLSIPLILGSAVGFLIFLAYPFIIAFRIKKEEEFLIVNLPGYREYIKKVKYRMIPSIW